MFYLINRTKRIFNDSVCFEIDYLFTLKLFIINLHHQHTLSISTAQLKSFIIQFQLHAFKC